MANLYFEREKPVQCSLLYDNGVILTSPERHAARLSTQYKTRSRYDHFARWLRPPSCLRWDYIWPIYGAVWNCGGFASFSRRAAQVWERSSFNFELKRSTVLKQRFNCCKNYFETVKVIYFHSSIDACTGNYKWHSQILYVMRPI